MRWGCISSPNFKDGINKISGILTISFRPYIVCGIFEKCKLLNCSVLFLTFPCCCGSWSEGHVVIPATTEMTTRMVTRAWLMSSMLLQWDRLKCWHSGLHFDHQNWLESWQPAVICNDLQLISLKTFPSPWSTETAACTAVSVLVQQQSFCLIFKLNECYPAGLSTGLLFIGSAWNNSENLLDD